jgi:hypothetical protein
MTKKKSSAKENKAAGAAKTGFPPSPVADLTDHSMPASELAAQVDPKGQSGASVNAASIDAVSTDETPVEDKSIVGKIRKSGLHMIHNHVLGENYVGISPQNDEKASAAEKRLSGVFPLDGIAPRTGMIVKPTDGPAFSIGDGYGPEKTPQDWAGIVNPNTDKPLFG